MKTWCYWNLHKQCVSYKLGSSGRVHHAASVVLDQVKFHVQPAGRKRVIEEQRKNVHSFVLGGLIRAVPVSAHESELLVPSVESLTESGYRKAYYNPYKTDVWIDALTGDELTHAWRAVVQNKQVWYKSLPS